MHNLTMSRWLSPLMAFCLSFLIIASLAPMIGIDTERQLDFWGLWLVTMIVLALPLVYLEIALAKRSKTTALAALGQLTRDAESSTHWRLVGWLAVAFMPFLAGNMLFGATKQLSIAGLSQPIVLAIAIVVALALSVLPRLILILISSIAVIAALIASQMGAVAEPWQMTPVEFSEWGGATLMALVATGLGLGAYWQTSVDSVAEQKQATPAVLPIWLAQIVAVIAFGFFALNSQTTVITLLIASVFGSAVLLQLARQQLAQRQITVILQWIIVLVAVAVWLIPSVQSVLSAVLAVWGLVICLIYAIFAGWIMKISHLRKSLNFSNEAIYNIWRIAVRIVLPLAIILALISLVGTR